MILYILYIGIQRIESTDLIDYIKDIAKYDTTTSSRTNMVQYYFV